MTDFALTEKISVRQAFKTEKLAVVLPLLFLVLELAKSAANDRALSHRVMCALTTAADKTVGGSEDSSTVGEGVDLLLALNFSTSSANWTAMFDTSGDTVKPVNPNDFVPAGPVRDEWTKAWPLWWKAAKKAATEHISTEKNANYKAITNEENKAEAHKAIELQARAAAKLKAKYTELAQGGPKGTANLINGRLKAALYGTGTADVDKMVPKALPALSSWATACTKQTSGIAIAADFLCACNNNADTTKQCNSGYTPHNWGAAITLSSQWPALRSSCITHGPQTPSAAEIGSGIGSFEAALQTKDNTGTLVATLGAPSGNNCDGTEAGLCVDYTQYYGGAANTKGKAMPWMQNLKKAAEAITARQTALAASHAIAAQIEALRTEADSVYLQAAAGKFYISSARSSHVNSKPQPSINREAECNAAVDDRKKCENLKEKDCTFNDKAKKCELKKEVKAKLEKAETKWDGKDGKTNSKGSKYIKRKECEAEAGTPSPSNKSVCRWN
uniref:Variant surface glycoprotein 1125.4176 n=1 Tax=Trypanosoma brucei TaxID=5691 RepID=A0A1J0RAG0_9TRYP|nr:variant surface glycoprotein 1125.4176 [Trypanosoma brucei]